MIEWKLLFLKQGQENKAKGKTKKNTRNKTEISYQTSKED